MTPMGFASYDGSHGRAAVAPDDHDGESVVHDDADQADDDADADDDAGERQGMGMDPIRARIDPQQAEAALSDRDRRILEFERQWWKYAGAKEQAIRDLFDMSPTRYYQILNNLIDTPQALAVDPMLVKRLRRMRAARQRARSARRLGIEPN
jgi:hypothetical protein